MKKVLLYLIIAICFLLLIFNVIQHTSIFAADEIRIGLGNSIKLDKDCVATFDKAQITSNVTTFNRYTIIYSSNIYIKGTLTYKINNVTEQERFFLEPTGDKEQNFTSFINGYIDNRCINKIDLISIEFENIDDSSGNFKINSFDLISFSLIDDFIFSINEGNIDNNYRDQKTIFVGNDNIKLGLSLKYGGSINYISGNSNIFSDNYANVNLVNSYDNGRLIQQCYYGNMQYVDSNGNQEPYVKGVNDVEGMYNPIQGGNQNKQYAKVVDIQISSDKRTVVVKTKPSLWQLDNQNYINDFNDYYEGYTADAYMITKYVVYDTYLAAENSYIDFTDNVNNTDHGKSRSESPATYVMSDLDEFYTYNMLTKSINTRPVQYIQQNENRFSITNALEGDEIVEKGDGSYVKITEDGEEQLHKAIWSCWGGYFSTKNSITEGLRNLSSRLSYR